MGKPKVKGTIFNRYQYDKLQELKEALVIAEADNNERAIKFIKKYMQLIKQTAMNDIKRRTR